MKNILLSIYSSLRNQRRLDWLILCAVALTLTLIWFREGILIGRGEMGLVFEHPERTLSQLPFSWWDVATGFQNSQSQGMLFLGFISALGAIGFPSVYGQAITFFILLAGSELSMYGLTRFLIKGNAQRTASLAAGFVYMLNLSAVYSWHRLGSIIFVAPLLPLIMLLYLRGLKDESNVWKDAIYVNLAIIFPLIAFANVYYLSPYILIFLTVFCLFIAENIKEKSRCIHGIKFSVAVIFLMIMLNLWWTLPSFSSAQTSLGRAEQLGPLDTLQLVSSSYHKLVYMITLFPSDFFYRFFPVAANPVYAMMTYVLPILAFGALSIKGKDKYVLYFALLALLDLFLITGSEPPGGLMFVSAFKLLMPFSAGFRDPYSKFSFVLALSYTLLFSITLSCINQKAERKKAKLVLFLRESDLSDKAVTILNPKQLRVVISLVMVAIVVLPSAYVMFSGSIFDSSRAENPILRETGYYVEVPNSYIEANKWLAEQTPQFRIIAFPLSLSDGVAYRWRHGYVGLEPWNLWSKPRIAVLTWEPRIDKLVQELTPFLSQSNQFWKAMAILNAKYALVQKDVYYPSSFAQRSPDDYLAYLEKAEVLDYTHSKEVGLDKWTKSGVFEQTNVIDNSTLVDNQASIKITASTDLKESWCGGIRYEWENPENLSNYKFVSFWIKFESLKHIHRVYVSFSDANENYEIWEITNQVSASWTKILVDLSSLPVYRSTGDLDLSSVKGISTAFEKTFGPMDAATWWVSGVKLLPTKILEQVHVSKSEAFGNLTFFKVEDNFFLPIIFATNQFNFTDDIKTMFNSFATSPIDPRNTTMFLLSQINEKDVQFINNLKLSGQQPPKITFQKIDPTKYEVHIENATGPFFLVFSNTYDRDWVAYFGAPDWIQTFSTKHVPNEYHFIANGYANAWYINPNEIDGDGDGDFTITLYFRPQNLFYIGAIISLATFAPCITYLLTDRARKFLRSRHKTKSTLTSAM